MQKYRRCLEVSCYLVVVIATAVLWPARTSQGADNVAGNLILLNPAGGWCWFQDERAVVDVVGGKLLVGSVRTVTNTTNVEVVTYDLASGRRQKFGLADLDEDDHAAPALLILPDGRYLAAYTMHYDSYSRFRISNSPHDGTSWGSEIQFRWGIRVPGFSGTVTYSNLYYLSNEGRIYNFVRGKGKVPNILMSEDGGMTWAWGTPDPTPSLRDDNDSGQLLSTVGIGYASAYYKYASNGIDTIHLIGSEAHPRDYNNNLFHAYIQNGKLYRSDGTLVDPDIFDESIHPAPTDLTQVFAAAPLEQGYNRAWAVDLELDSSGYPYAIFTTRWNNLISDHRFHYARFDGTQWHVYEIAKAGGALFTSEEDYTGLAALDPHNPNVVYISTPVDPRTQQTTPHHEIYKGVTTDGGATWTWTAITENSTVNNFRPIVPKWDADHTVLLWTRGTMINSQNYDLAVVGLILRADEQPGRIHYVDASEANTTQANGLPIGATGPDETEGAADGLWHWRSGVGNGGSVLASGGSGGENAPMLKTTLSGLADGLYDIFAFFWADPNQDWRIQVGFDPNNLLLVRDNGAQQAEVAHFDGEVVLTAGSAALYRVYVGRTEVINGSPISVFIDDLGADLTTRTWYDGLGYALVPEPATIVVPASGLVVLFIRRKTGLPNT